MHRAEFSTLDDTVTWRYGTKAGADTDKLNPCLSMVKLPFSG
jgi:hypothetical protein